VNKAIFDDDPYIDRKEPFLDAALPPAGPGIEFAFDMFLADFQDIWDKRLKGLLSVQGHDALFGHGIQEWFRNEEGYEFQRVMDVLFYEVDPENHEEAIARIADAFEAYYQTRRMRYSKILDSLSSSDRQVVQSHFFDQLETEVGPCPRNPRFYQFQLTVNFPDGNPDWAKRTWTYGLGRGIPKFGAGRSCLGDGVDCTD
jgi:hypothetical protein